MTIFSQEATFTRPKRCWSKCLLSSPADTWLRIRAVETVREILSDPAVHIIPQSHESFLSGFELYAARPDKGYSLTDCISMHTMRREGLTEALTNDRHFEQEGFRALFREPGER